MSKMDSMRAMREAKYAQRQAGGTGGIPARRTPVAPSESRAASAPDPEGPSSEALCGHRNLSGRTCTRESGHAAASHRYS
jgi:hypothetical protein